MSESKKDETMSKIKRLCDRVRSLVDSDENKKRLKLWRGTAGLPNIFTRYIPKENVSMTPFIADLDREMWAPVLGLSIERIYTDPYSYLEFELSKKIFAFENFDDDNPITKNITIWFGVGFSATLLGLEQEPAKNGHEPWVGKKSIIKRKGDLQLLELPDFYRSGLAPLAHKMYSQIKEVINDDFNVIFPEWDSDSGPFGIAMHLRGVEDFSIDMIDDPGFVHDLMKFILKAKVHWSQERAKFLNTKIIPLYLANDDVNVPIISPKGYKEFVLPYEKRISEFHGGIEYWHSCGRIDPILTYIKEIPHLKMIHVSHSTDLQKSVEIIGKDNIIEIVLNPIDDVEKATPLQMESKLREIKRVCEGLNFTVRADAFQVLTSVENDLKQIKLWIGKARKVLHTS
jgi:hypothetical protein